MKKIVGLILFFCALKGQAQNPNDCVNAIEVCGDLPIGIIPEGIGINEFELPGNFDPPCNAPTSRPFETASIWFKFEIVGDGSLAFDLIPTNKTDDYDFAIYRTTDCSNLGEVVRCSTTSPRQSPSHVPDAITGLGFNDEEFTEGPGFDGNGYVRYIDAVAGETYYMIIDLAEGISSFQIQMTGTAQLPAPPEFNEPQTVRFLDDDICTSDQRHFFDLGEQRDLITNGFPLTRVSFHHTLNDANQGINPIPDNFTNSTNPQTLFARLFLETGACTEIREIDFEILTTADLQYPDEHLICSPDFPLGYDLSGLRQQLAGTDTRNLSINFHRSFEDAINLQNPLEVLTITALPYSLYISTVLVDDPENCPAVNVITLQNSPKPTLQTPSDIYREEVCEVDGESMTIDFTQQVADILNGRDPISYKVALFGSSADRTNQSNPLPINYLTDDRIQTIYLRLTDLATGCYNESEFYILPQQITAYNNGGSIVACDDASQDGLVWFDFQDQIRWMTLDHENTDITYHLLKEDAVNGENALPLTFQSSREIQTVYLRIIDSRTSCFTILERQLYQGQVLQPQQPIKDTINLCEMPFVDYPLFDFRDELEAQNGTYNYTFYNTENDAYAKNNPIDGIPVTSDENYFWIATENPYRPDLCPLIQRAAVIIEENPEPGAVASLSICEPSGNATLDFSDRITDILNGRSEDDFDVNLYLDAGDRENQINALPTVTTLGAGNRTVFVELINTASGCAGYSQFQLTVTGALTWSNPNTHYVCQPVLPLEYDLDAVRGQLIDSNPYLDFTFFLTETDARTNTNAINSISLNALPQNIYALPSNPADPDSCGSPEIVALVEAPNPDINWQFEFENTDLCDLSQQEILLDLAEIRQTILEFRNDGIHYFLDFYASENDRALQQNKLPDNFYTVNQAQSLYLQLLETDTGCITDEEIAIVPGSLNAYNAPQNLAGCDGQLQDGSTVFDLAAQRDAIITGFPDIDVTFHSSLADAENNVNALQLSYRNTLPSETIYSRIFNPGAVCTAIEPFTVSISPILSKDQPTPRELYICDPQYPIDYGLSALRTTLENQDNNLIYTFHQNEIDAYAQQNAIDRVLVNQDITPVYVVTTDPSRPEFCPLVERTEILAVSRPVPGIATTLEICDANESLINVNLSQSREEILAGLPAQDFSVQFFASEVNRANRSAPLPDDLLLPATDHTIYVVLTDLRTLCYRYTDFEILSLASPVFEMNDQTYCIDSGLPFTLRAPEGYAYYIWSTGEEGPDMDTVQVNEGGMYSVTVINEENCESTRTLGLHISTAPQVVDIEVTAFQYPNNTVTVEATGKGDYVYALDDGPFQESNVFTAVSRGYHTVTIQDTNGCGSVSEEILVLEYTRIFTPNDDGVNDVFKIVGLDEYPGSEVIIFDRYGKTITILDANAYGWDGMYNGRPAFMTDYWFVLKMPDGFEVKGHFSLIR